MTRVAARLLASLVCIPITVVICALVSILADRSGGAFAFVGIVITISLGPILCLVGWLVIWAPLIQWTPRRRWNTVAALSAMLLAEGAVPVAMRMLFAMNRGDWSGFSSIANLLVGLGAMLVCLRLWCESHRERMARVQAADTSFRHCPVCRYDMSGLTNLRCPECGGEFTLGQISDEHRRRLAPADLG